MWISDRINWIISKRAKPIFFKITSYQSIYHDESNDVKFGFGVDLLNIMASSVRGVNSSSTRKTRSKSSNNPHMSDVKCFIENRTQNASTRNGAQVSSSMMPIIINDARDDWPDRVGQPGQVSQ